MISWPFSLACAGQWMGGGGGGDGEFDGHCDSNFDTSQV